MPMFAIIDGGRAMRGSMEDLMREITGRISKGDDFSLEEASPVAGCATDNMRRLADAGASAKITGRCGETMEVYFRLDGEKIVEATFFTDGCSFSVLCGHAAAKLAEQRTLEEAAEIEADSILSVIGRVPQEEAHCAELAAETVRAAVHDWMLKRRLEP